MTDAQNLNALRKLRYFLSYGSYFVFKLLLIKKVESI